jgi:5-methylcytosine-specific restriction protein A
MRRVPRPYELRPGWANRPAGNAYAYRGHWPKRVREVLERDGYRCRLNFPDICIGRASQVDHIVQPEAGGTNDPSNLRAVCVPCHRRRTGRQGAAASRRRFERKEQR